MKQDLCALLRGNSYPGRGIMLGRSADNKSAVIAYFIMGRSENSRNRVFEETEDGIRTKAFDESKMTDPSLIIYHPVRRLESGLTIVTNGDQTDTIRDMLAQGHCYRHALNTRTFEPDGPNWTPRILKSMDGDESCCCRYFFEYDAPVAGTGHFISTYRGDGSPLPSFAGEPIPVDVAATNASTLARELWESLNAENKVSLFVQFRSLAGSYSETSIINKNG